MKNSLIKFLPIAAAVLLATSCSKDDNDNAPATQSGSDGVETVTANTIPFSIRVNTGHSLKKVGYAESTNESEKGWYNITFSDNDVANKLKMIIKEGNTQIGEATLQSDKATFSGSLTKQPSSNTADLTAEISVSGSKNSSDVSLADLLATCAHTFLGTFTYGDEKVDLTDQNAYLAITMSPCCEHEIKINTTDYTVKDGRIWVAVPANAPVTSEGLGKELNQKSTEVSPGTIYTVARQYFSVAHGKKVYFSPGNLQYNPKQDKWQFAAHQYDICIKADNNDVSSMYDKDYDGWIDLFGWGMWLVGQDQTKTVADNTYYLPGVTSCNFTGASAIGSECETLTREEFQYLFGSNVTRANKYGVAQVAGVNGLIILPDDWTGPKPDGKDFKSGVADDYGSDFYATKNTYSAEDWAKMEANGAVFLPAAGFRSGAGVYSVGSHGLYWSSSAGDEHHAFDLYFLSGRVDPGDVSNRFDGLSVRLVRAL